MIFFYRYNIGKTLCWKIFHVVFIIKNIFKAERKCNRIQCIALIFLIGRKNTLLEFFIYVLEHIKLRKFCRHFQCLNKIMSLLPKNLKGYNFSSTAGIHYLNSFKDLRLINQYLYICSWLVFGTCKHVHVHIIHVWPPTTNTPAKWFRFVFPANNYHYQHDWTTLFYVLLLLLTSNIVTVSMQ